MAADAVALAVLKECCADRVNLGDTSALNFKRIGGAMTNAVYKVDGGSLTKPLLLRVYGEGTETFFPRTMEADNAKHLSDLGLAPAIIGMVDNGRVETFLIDYKTLKADDIRDPVLMPKIAKELHRLHVQSVGGKLQPSQAQVTLKRWHDAALEMCTDERFNHIPMSKLIDEIEFLRRALPESPVVFAHCDLQHGNIMLGPDGTLVLCDFEYSQYMERGFDIANHFCEMAADYALTPPLDYDNRFPSLEERRKFCKLYLDSHGASPSDAEVERLVEEAEHYALVSHLWWALWGLIQVVQSRIAFDYMGYAEERLKRYREKALELHGRAHL